MRTIKVAQIGTSETGHAMQVFRTMTAHPEVFDIVGYADVDCHSKPLNKAFQGYRKLDAEAILAMPDLDAVLIECDENLQTHYAMQAAKRGLPIHLEKPGGQNPEAFQQLMDQVEAGGLLLHTGYMYRYNPAVLYALEAVRSGRLGRVYSITADMSCLHTPEMRRWLKNCPGGMMFYLGCHLVDLIYLFQGVPDAVLPMNCTVEPGYGQDFGMAVFQYQDGVSTARVSAAEPGGFQRRQLVICGTKGTIEIKPLEKLMGGDLVSTELVEYYASANGTCPWNREGKRILSEPYNRYESMLLTFAAMVRGEVQNVYTPAYERSLHRLLMQACNESHIR